MRTLIVIPFLSLFILLSAFSEKKSFYFPTTVKKVGVYDRDSILEASPAYHNALDSAASYQKILDQQLGFMKDGLTRKQNEFNTDSLQWSPLVRELKRKEIADSKNNILAFTEQAGEDFIIYKEHLINPINDYITFSANDLANKKRLDAVLDKNELIGYQAANPSAKVINVTNEMKVKLRIPK